MPAVQIAIAALFALLPAVAAAEGHGEGVSQYRNGPFNEFDLTAIGVTLVVVMIVLGVRAVKGGR